MLNEQKIVNEKYLFYGLITIFLPIYITSSFQLESMIYTAGIMLVYLFQTAILLYMFKDGMLRFGENKKACIILLLFIISQLVVLVFSHNNSFYKELVNILVFAVNGFIIIGACHYKLTLSQAQKFMRWFVQFSIAACIYNFFINYGIIVKVILGLNNKYVQISSFLPNRNTFGFLLVCAIYALLFIMNLHYEKWHLFAFILFVFNLILTMSRTSIIATAIIIICEIVYMCISKDITIKMVLEKIFSSMQLVRKHGVIIFTLCILFIISFAGILYQGNFRGDSFQSQILRTGDISNASGRFGLWEMAVSIWKENPIFGVGRFQAVSVLEQAGSSLNQFHNAYIEALVSYGVFGLCLMLTLFIWIIVRILKSTLNNNIKVVLISFYLSIAFQSLLETRIRFACGLVDTFTIFFIVLIPLLLANAYIDNDKDGAS